MYSAEDIEKYKLQYTKIAKKAVASKNIDAALDALYHSGALQHIANISLTDPEGEEIIKEIAYTMPPLEIDPSEDRVMLYDSIVMSNIALSMQYLRSMAARNKKFFYVVNYKDESRAEKLLKIAENCPCCEIFKVDRKLSFSEQLNYLRDIIKKTKPSDVLLHMSNSDPVGCAAFENITGITRFFINHGDEQFWFGRDMLDYCIEFRGMGKDASVSYRNLKPDQCLIQPYYPILSSEEFKGFDFEIPEGSVRIFSGGRFSKVYGENFKFMHTVKDMLLRNENVFFIFAGSGDKSPMEDFVIKNHLASRWKIISYRNDLLEILKRMDIYLGTYPQAGGLMAQYAAEAGVPVLEMDTRNGGVTEDILPKFAGKSYKITCMTWEEYNKTLDRLISDENYRAEAAREIKGANLSPDEFFNDIRNLISGKKSSYSCVHRKIDLKVRSERQLEAENRYLHRIPGIMCSKVMAKNYPLTAAHNIIMCVFYKKLQPLFKKIKQ